MVRALGNIDFHRDGWQSDCIEQLARIYLVISGYQHLDQQTPALQADINSQLGFTVNQEELKESAGIMDTWLVLGKQSYEDQGITTERYWLFGSATRRYALILQFIVRGQGAQLSLTPGLRIRAELVFFPSSVPLRALIKRQIQADNNTDGQGFANWAELTDATTTTVSALPFDGARPCIVHRLTPVRHAKQWWLKDEAQNLMPVRENFRGIWKLLSFSGGEPLDMALIGKDRSFEPIGVWHDRQYKII